MYLRGHGGATVDDLAWWCGLGKTECKKAIALIEKELEKIEYNGKIYYYSSVSNPIATVAVKNDTIKLLG